MTTPTTWKGYQKDFLDGFEIQAPDLKNRQADLAKNSETGDAELPFINFSSYQSVSRRLPVFTASNIFRAKWVQAAREGDFQKDSRLKDDEQFSSSIYSGINKNQTNSERKMAKGHMTRREDVQWDVNLNKDNAIQAAEATFHYSNACPQHQALNNEIWKELENSILVKGVSKEPQKAIVFTGPVLDDNDPLLVIHGDKNNEQIKCPLRFWKVIYYVNDKNELHYASFLMSHKDLVEKDGYVAQKLKLTEGVKGSDKPFLDFDENEKYQVRNSLIEDLTGLKFFKAMDALAPGQHSKLTHKLAEQIEAAKVMNYGAVNKEVMVEGLVL